MCSFVKQAVNVMIVLPEPSLALSHCFSCSDFLTVAQGCGLHGSCWC